MTTPKLGFIGFGEAAFSISLGLVDKSDKPIKAFDQLQSEPTKSPYLIARTKKTGVVLCRSLDELIAESDILISTVTANASLKVATKAGMLLSSKHFYLDLNSVSPKTKMKAALAIENPRGAQFIEGAVMAAVPPLRNKVPILLSGPSVPAFIKKMAPFDFNFSHIGSKFGQAAAIKMFRSIIIKGIESLLQESLLAASEYDAGELVLQSIQDSYSEINWKQLASYLLRRTTIHGKRRVQEMEQVIETLKDLNVEPIMAKAISNRLKKVAKLGLQYSFAGHSPVDHQEIINEIKKHLD